MPEQERDDLPEWSEQDEVASSDGGDEGVSVPEKVVPVKRKRGRPRKSEVERSAEREKKAGKGDQTSEASQKEVEKGKEVVQEAEKAVVIEEIVVPDVKEVVESDVKTEGKGDAAANEPVETKKKGNRVRAGKKKKAAAAGEKDGENVRNGRKRFWHMMGRR